MLTINIDNDAKRHASVQEHRALNLHCKEWRAITVANLFSLMMKAQYRVDRFIMLLLVVETTWTKIVVSDTH